MHVLQRVAGHVEAGDLRLAVDVGVAVGGHFKRSGARGQPRGARNRRRNEDRRRPRVEDARGANAVDGDRNRGARSERGAGDRDRTRGRGGIGDQRGGRCGRTDGEAKKECAERCCSHHRLDRRVPRRAGFVCASHQIRKKMRVTCVGGGPAGLYFGILIKRRFPEWPVRVLERNRPLDTFGWGVVFSDATLENLRAADEQTHREITRAFAHWDDIEIHFDGHTIRLGRPRLLRDRAQASARDPARARRGARRRAGVRARSRRRRGRASATATCSSAPTAINSRVRATYASEFARHSTAGSAASSGSARRCRWTPSRFSSSAPSTAGSRCTRTGSTRS